MNNKNTILMIALAISLSACAKDKQNIKTPDPIIIVAEPTKPAEVTRPSLPIDQLTPESTDEDVAKAYAASAPLLKIYSKQLEEALKPYKDAYENWLKKSGAMTSDQQSTTNPKK